jgi:hypothetical protein
MLKILHFSKTAPEGILLFSDKKNTPMDEEKERVTQKQENKIF